MSSARLLPIAMFLACGQTSGSAGSDGTGDPSSSSDDGTSTGVIATSSSGEAGSADTSAAGSDTGDAPPSCVDPPSEPPCAATGAGRCYYIDPIAGDDADGDGSFASPWRSFVPIDASAYEHDGVALAGGDVVYVRAGEISSVYHPGDDSGSDGGGSYLLYLRGLAGDGAPITIQRYPGERPVLIPPAGAMAVLVLQSHALVISGFEIRGAWGRGIRIEEDEDVVIDHVLVYDTDGTVADNVAGLEILGSRDVVVEDSVFADNYDRAAAAAGTQTENSGNLVLFSNPGDVTIRRCAFYQSEGPLSQSSGFGIKYKHASPDPTAEFTVVDSYFEGTTMALGIGTAHAHIEHNVVVDAGDAIRSEDFGGPTHQWDQSFVGNTLIAAVGLSVSPSRDWAEAGGLAWPDVTDNRFVDNLVVDTAAEHTGERRTVVFDPYMSDALHDVLADGITLDGNCYHAESGPASFGFAEAENYGAAGGAYDLAGWRAAYGFDVGSIEADPALAELVPDPTGPCADTGAFTGDHTPAVGLGDPLACGDAVARRPWL